MQADAQPLPFNAGNPATVGVWRVRHGTTTAIEKIIQPPPTAFTGSPQWQTSTDPLHWNYWKRELLAYRTGLCREVFADAGLCAPAVLDARKLPEGRWRLVLADCPGRTAAAWTVADSGDFANRLGRAQARFVHQVPRISWLSHNWLGQYLADRDVDPDPDWTGAFAQTWPPHLRAGLQRLWERRRELLAVAAALPRTLCHLDVWPMNLFTTGDQYSIIDWAFIGEGAVGEDVSNLIVDSMTDGLYPPSILPELVSASTEGYLAGLRASGCRLDVATVRRGIAATGAAKYTWLAPAMLRAAQRAEPVGAVHYGLARPATEAFDHRRELFELLVSWARLAEDG
ncbi:hypothetical protein ACFQY4_23335 [Catellatospora bangladeshensis]|uniref:Aminoglycoside phosphotransferase domain-containing protein n=1 Tax=Catellatospora bangladeshensis TaxID=310355 RepID=A0A8J3NGE7_9ACTN|nr:hypothetical protein [Catellatospora bangladeshensis]GIF80277.1 hypothetical protein Cba03nite_16260 [Catellatospora bangladeshensis]